MTDPAGEYAARLDARRTAHAHLVALDARLSYGRLAVFGAGVVLLWLVFRLHMIHAAVLAAPVIAFTALVRRHDLVIRRRDAAARAIAFYERGVARLEDRWSGGGESGSRFRTDEHPYANDLDLFGEGSLFELLSIARTRAGEETLAAWLTTPALPAEVRERQDAVRELTPQLDLRESLALAGTDVRAAVLTEALLAWAAAPPRFHVGWLPVAAWVLTLSTVLTGTLWGAGGAGAPLLIAVVLGAIFSYAVHDGVTHVLHGSDRPVRDLDVLAHALEHLERASFASPRLARVRASVASGVRAERRPAHAAGAASAAIRRLHRLSEMHDWQHNMVFAPIAAVLLWGPHLAFAIERWRREHGAHVAAWLAAVGEIEAFSSLATYRYEHPGDPFPDLVEGAAAFEGVRIGHPLIPVARMVPNDVALSGATRLLVISGSNMSGKSTMLRTVGINAVLALMGAPVRAAGLRLTPLTLGATLRIQDSLQEGRSRFYAEITRLRQLADAATGPVPLLFLLDELFHGTNSHDRLIGAAGVLRSLLERGAIGLITTHDLALTAVADDLAPRAVNVHFEDHFDGGEIRFDYAMRPGPVTRSNALALMRAVGLDVGEE